MRQCRPNTTSYNDQSYSVRSSVFACKENINVQLIMHVTTDCDIFNFEYSGSCKFVVHIFLY